jgi:hypothetical protein
VTVSAKCVFGNTDHRVLLRHCLQGSAEALEAGGHLSEAQYLEVG